MFAEDGSGNPSEIEVQLSEAIRTRLRGGTGLRTQLVDTRILVLAQILKLVVRNVVAHCVVS